MDTRTLSPLERELALHAGWVRALARRLVRDDGEAEDLAQEAWLAALRAPPREGTAWRPWLGRVVRTLALRRWRRPRARGIDDELAERASLGSASSPAELSLRLEAERILIEELSALPEAQRRVLVMRYFDGLDAREIGLRTGEPHGTVRWRLSEGLAALRKRLDARYGGDRPTWCRALALSFGGGASLAGGPLPTHAPAAPPAPVPASNAPPPAPHAPTFSSAPLAPASTLPLTFGVLLVNSAAKIATAVALLLSVSTGLYLWIDGPSPTPPLELSAGEPATSAPAAIESGPELAGPKTSEASVASRSALAAESAAPAALPVVRPPARVEARALDATLVPIATARLGRLDQAEPVATSRGDGTLVLELAAREKEEDVDFEVSAPGFGTRFLRARMRPDATLFLGDVILPAGGAIRGRVVDSNGRGIGALEVLATSAALDNLFGANELEAMRERGPRYEVAAPRARSAQDGSFLVEGVETGVVRLWARGPDRRWNVGEVLDVVAREETGGVVLVVRSAAEQDPGFAPIEGVVVDDRGEPVPKARIQVTFRSENFSRSRGVTAEDDGTFRIAVEDKSPHDLSFHDPKNKLLGVTLPGVRPGTKDLRIALGAAKLVTLRVREGRTPVERFTAHVRSVDQQQQGLAAEGDVHEEGRVEVQVPRYAFTYQIAAKGYWTKELGPYDERSVPAEIDVELEPSPGIQGRVLAGGEPRAGVRVRLYSKPRGTRIEANNYRTTIVPTAKSEASTDERGEFQLDVAEDGRYVVCADADGYARAELGPLEVVAAQGSRGNELVLGPGGAIEGRVRMPPGRDVAGVIVAVNRGDAAPRTQVVGRDGEFRFERLTPGPWEVRRVKEEFHGVSSTGISTGGVTEAEIEASCRVHEGETTRFDLDLSAWEPAVLVAELSVNGQPARAWAISMWPSGEGSVTGALPGGITDAEGRARIETDDARAWELTLQPPPESGSDYRARFLKVLLQGGENPWRQELTLGRIEGRVRGDLTAPLRYVDKAAGKSNAIAVTPDADGRFVLPFAPAGPGTFERAAVDGKQKSWSAIGEVECVAGKTVTLELP